MVRGFIPEKLKKYWPTYGEQGEYTGPFSTFAEYHAFGIGLGAAATCSVLIMTAVVLYSLGMGKRRQNSSGHIEDLVKEPAYAVGAIGIGRLYFCGGQLASLGPIF